MGKDDNEKNQMSEKDKNNPHNKEKSGDDFEGPSNCKRGCRDVFCIILFGVALAG
jgi:hypothetical protein